MSGETGSQAEAPLRGTLGRSEDELKKGKTCILNTHIYADDHRSHGNNGNNGNQLPLGSFG